MLGQVRDHEPGVCFIKSLKFQYQKLHFFIRRKKCVGKLQYRSFWKQILTCFPMLAEFEMT